MEYKKIGLFLAQERKAKKFTQAEVAEKLYVSEKTISKWENGRGLPDTSSFFFVKAMFPYYFRLFSDNFAHLTVLRSKAR